MRKASFLMKTSLRCVGHSCVPTHAKPELAVFRRFSPATCSPLLLQNRINCLHRRCAQACFAPEGICKRVYLHRFRPFTGKIVTHDSTQPINTPSIIPGRGGRGTRLRTFHTSKPTLWTVSEDSLSYCVEWIVRCHTIE